MMIRSKMSALFAVATVAGVLAVVVPAAPAVAAPPTAPSLRFGMGMTYDAAHGQVVLFGGCCLFGPLGDTWTWDGTDWTQRTPAHGPGARLYMGMADDAAHGQVMLFGGANTGTPLGDTWTWDGTDWAVPFRPSMKLTPKSGPPGTLVLVQGWAFGAAEVVVLTFIDSITGTTKLAEFTTGATGAFAFYVGIPVTATPWRTEGQGEEPGDQVRLRQRADREADVHGHVRRGTRVRSLLGHTNWALASALRPPLQDASHERRHA